MSNDYKTTDIVLAAYLKLNGCELDTIIKTGNKGTFEFKNVDQQLIIAYDLGNVLVEPILFNNTIKQLTTSVRRMA